MRKIRSVFACLGIILGLASAKPAHAQNQHSFVSAAGSGTACTFSLPCYTIGIALAATNSGGIVTCVDQGANAAGNGVVGFIVTKSITIDCAGTAAGSFNVVINGAGIVVTLRNLQINAVGATPDVPGIDFQNGAALFVEHCVVEHWQGGSGVGILFAPPAGVMAKLHVTDSVIKNNGIAVGGGGIFIQPSGSGSARVVIERTQVENNTHGIYANGTLSTGRILVEIKDSTVANNVFNGIWANSMAGAAITSLVVDHSSSVQNGGSGIAAQGTGSYGTLTDSSVLWNAIGLNAFGGGGIFSFGNNRLGGNSSPGAPSGVFALQ